jgi:hypothetical protein
MLARQFALVGIVISLLTGCSAQPPDIGRGASSNYAFNERVQQRFPVGSDESVLVAALRREQFRIEPAPSKPGRFVARFEAEGLPCKRTWTLLWSTDQRKISDIEARYGEICL